MNDTRTEDRDALLRRLLQEKFEPVAIVGLGLRFPGGQRTPEGLAAFLRQGRDGTGPIPPDRWDVAAFATDDAQARGKILTRGGGFVDGIDQFDARFFNIAPKEAQFIDPQHRLVLECAWEALEHAQIDPHSLKDGDAGVYVGIAGVDYMLAMESLPWADLDGHVGTGTSHSSAAGRVSYFLGLRGPCIALDTACSSSLVTVHLAAQALRRRECSLALAGGVNVIHHPRHHIAFTRAHMLAADGRCKTFDDRADGYGRSEGGGMVVLKRLSDALADGDRLWAVLRGSAVAQDGESGGLTVPNGTAQEAVMRQALAAGMVQPQDVSLIEAHGTGTPLGDPIELGAVHAVFGTARAGREAPWVSSVKTNIGHMEAAAGVGGLVKAVLQLQEGRIYPHLHLETPSTRIPWQRLHLRVPTALEAFPPGPRRAVVNSFGFSGIIASVVLEAPPPVLPASAPPPADVHLFALSARSPAALAELARAHASRVQALPDEPAALQAWCRAATVGRAHFARRQATVVSDRDSLVRWLEAAARSGDEAEHAARTPWRVAFLCTGQGAQVSGMGRALAARFPVFAQALDDCDRRFAPLLGRSIRALMWGEVDDPRSLHQTLYTQPALFAHAWAAGCLWQSFGVAPTVVIGHSIGELAAAALAGVFTLDDAVRLVAARAQAMQAVTREGGMLAVSGSAQKVAPFLKGQSELGFAAFNTPGQCVISGAREALATVQQALTDAGVRCTPLPVSHAFHSVLMREAFEPFRRAFDGVRARSPQVAVVSNLDGEEVGAGVLADPEHWVRQLTEPVRFLQGMRAVAARGRHLMIELGPCPVLGGLGRASVEAADHLWIASAQGRVGQAAEDSARSLLDGVARAYEAGLGIRWAAVQGPGGARQWPVTLPGYPFERRRCWLPRPDAPMAAADGPVAALSTIAPATGAAAGLAVHPLLGRRLPEQPDGVRRHEQALSPAVLHLADHAVGDQVVFPAAGHVELVLAAMEDAFGETSRTLSLRIHEPLVLPAREAVTVQTRLAFGADGGAEVRIVSGADGRERLHASAMLYPPTPDEAPAAPDVMEVPAAAEAPQAFYARCDALGLHYGPGFRTVQAAWRPDDESVLATLAGPTPTGLALPPPLLDGALQSIALLLGGDITFLPVAIEAFRLHKKPRGALCSRIRRVEGDPQTDAVLRLDGLLWERTPQGPRVVAHWRGHTLRRMATSAGTAWHLPRWMPRSLPPAPASSPGSPARQLHWLGRGRPQATARQLWDAAAKAGLVQDTLDSPGVLAARLAAMPTADLVWCWPERADLQGLARVQAEADEGLADLLAWAQALGQAPAPARPVLWVVTAGTQAVRDTRGHGGEDALAGATAWGLAAVLANEAPRLRVCRVDLPVDADGHAEVQGLVDEWLASAGGAEPQLAFREGRRFVRRVVPAPDPGAEAANFRLVPPADGQLAHVRAQPVDAADARDPLLAPPLPDGPPGTGEIQVEVDAAGLNFKDVLNALGMLRQHALATGVPHQPLPLGFEAAGTVLAAGDGAGFAVGEAVLVNRSGAMQRRITVPARAAVRRPRHLDAREAAGQVTAYVTAWYALHHLAGMKAGDRVLIHAAAGGVGQAAVRLAQRAGAQVVATASPRKWDVLRRMGVSQVLKSRNTDFAEALRRDGVGQIDLVLNSLNKEFIPAGLSALAPGGRFVELGKVGAWSAEQVAAVRPDVRYHHFDLSEVDPAVMQQVNQEILTQVAAALDDGSLSPVATHGHALDELDEAFGVLARGANVGKLVIDFRPPQTHALAPLGAGGCVVVTGGFGGLGREVAAMLAAAGARHLVLSGRRRPSPEDEAALQARLASAAESAGHPPPGLTPVAADVATDAGLQALQQAVAASGRPLLGVVHAAGVLDDAPLAQLDPSRLGPVLAPKLAGGWRLHRWLREAAQPDAPPPWWIAFSSVAAGFGSPGQGNYAAANAFLDALAGWRDAQGLPGFSLAWGPFTEAGMAARLSDAQARAVRQRGLRFITPAQGMRWMRELMRSPRPPVPGAQILLGEVDWAALAASLEPTPLFDRVAPAAGPAEAAAQAAVDRDALAAMPASERALLVNAVLRECIAHALQLDGPDDVAPDAPFSELGLDSLVGVDLVNHLEARFGLSLPNAIIFDAPSVARLTDELLHRLETQAA